MSALATLIAFLMGATVWVVGVIKLHGIAELKVDPTFSVIAAALFGVANVGAVQIVTILFRAIF